VLATWHLGWAGSQRLRRLLRTVAWLRHQSLAEPHHLLLTVAVHPEVRGRGEGHRLLAATLALRQPDLLPCYVSTQVPSQLPFYQRQGFVLTGHCMVGRGPRGLLSNWSLMRPATF
jgi:predicted GNAT family N-acyltransferase